LTAHSLFDQPNDRHQNAAADPAGSDLTDNRSNIEITRPNSSSSGTAAEERTDDLRPDAAADDPGDSVADGSQVILLQRRAGDVAANASCDELDN
jgi:hypothetical protein